MHHACKHSAPQLRRQQQNFYRRALLCRVRHTFFVFNIPLQHNVQSTLILEIYLKIGLQFQVCTHPD